MPQTQPTAVPAIDKMCQILDLITEQPQPLTSAKIAKHLGRPRSSIHTTLQCLESKGIVHKDADNRYHLGSYLLYWAGKYEQSQQVIHIFNERIHQQPLLSQHTVTLSTRDGGEVVFLACHDSPAPLGFTFRAGVRVPATFSATGKAMLSTLSDTEIAALFADGLPTPMTEYGVDNLTDLLAEMAGIRDSRISLDNGQLREGMYCLGTYIRDASGKAVAGMAVSFLKREYEAKRDEVSAALIALATQIEGRLGVTTQH